MSAFLLAAQAAVGLALWAAYDASAGFREQVELVAGRPEVTDAFFLADMATVVASVAAAWAVWWGRPWALAAVGVTTGMILYPTAYLLAWVTSPAATGADALAIMVLPAVVNPWILLRTHRRRDGAPPRP